MGSAQFNGSGCSQKNSEVKLIDEAQSLYSIPLNLYVKKEEATQLDRKNCAVAIPLEVSAGEKVVVSNVQQNVQLRAYPSVTTKTQLEVFLTGQRGQVLKAEAVATDKYVNSKTVLSQDGEVAVTECGQNAILRANASGLIQGSAKGRVYHNDLKLQIKVVKCLAR